MHASILSVRHLSKAYGKDARRIPVLDDITLELAGPGLIALLGESGCGKTTLLNLLGGLDRDFAGTIELDGTDVRNLSDRAWTAVRARKIGFVFQDADLVPYLDVAENVGLALSADGRDVEHADERVREALEELGIASLAEKMPRTLSGGQAQRVAVARAVAKDPDIILADEPTGSLDEANAERAMAVLAEMAKTRLVVVATQNEPLACRYASRIVRLGDGCIKEDVKNQPEEAPSASVPSGKASPIKRAGRLTPLRLASRHALHRLGRSVATVAAIGFAVATFVVALAAGAGGQRLADTLATSSVLEHPLVASLGNVAALDVETQDADGAAGVGIDSSGISGLETARPSTPRQTMKALGDILDADDAVSGSVFSIQHDFGTELNLYAEDGTQLLADGESVLTDSLGLSGDAASQLKSGLSSYPLMRELVVAQDGSSPYRVVSGRMPESIDEVVLITDTKGKVLDSVAYALGILDRSDLGTALSAPETGAVLEEPASVAYDRIVGTAFKIVPTASYYTEEDGSWQDMRSDAAYLQDVLAKAQTLTVVGVVQPSTDFEDASFGGGLGYGSGLVEKLSDEASTTPIAKAQMASPAIDAFTGVTFAEETEVSAAEAAAAETRTDALLALARRIGLSDAKIQTLSSLNAAQTKKLVADLSQDSTGALSLRPDEEELLKEMTDEEFAQEMQRRAPAELDPDYAQNMRWLGVADTSNPERLLIYPRTAEGFQVVQDAVDSFNEGRDGSLKVLCESNAQDWIERARSITAAVDVVLIAILVAALAVSVFLVFSISSTGTLGRRREVGLLRALGFPERSIASLFMCEMCLLGVLAGLAGILAAELVVPVLDGRVVEAASAVAGYVGAGVVRVSPAEAVLAAASGIVLAVASGLVPALRIAKCSPADALRGEPIFEGGKAQEEVSRDES